MELDEQQPTLSNTPRGISKKSELYRKRKLELQKFTMIFIKQLKRKNGTKTITQRYDQKLPNRLKNIHFV